VILVTEDRRYLHRLQESGEHYLLKPSSKRQFTTLADTILTEVAARCMRREPSDGSSSAARTG
jgi:hypothetical protein